VKTERAINNGQSREPGNIGHAFMEERTLSYGKIEI
jgi:hypothetical protein